MLRLLSEFTIPKRNGANEDCTRVTLSFDHDSVVVCDGLGGEELPSLAAQVVADSMVQFPEVLAQCESLDQALAKTAILASEAISEKEEKLDSGRIAASMAMLVRSGHTYYKVWCGDVRIYHVRAGTLLSVTEDHSQGTDLVKRGMYSKEEVRRLRRVRSGLVAVSRDPARFEGCLLEDVQASDRFVICTDGFWAWFGEQELVDLISDDCFEEAKARVRDFAQDDATFVCLEVC